MRKGRQRRPNQFFTDQKGLKVGVGLQRQHESRYIETIKRIPQLKSWDEQPPIQPDADGTYKSSVAMPGIYDPFA